LKLLKISRLSVYYTPFSKKLTVLNILSGSVSATLF
jgi:heme O synthase-like polyprenyltransferase